MNQALHVTAGPAAARLEQHCAIGRFVAKHEKLCLQVVRQRGDQTTWQALDDRTQLTLPKDFVSDPRALEELAQHRTALLVAAAHSTEIVWQAWRGFHDFGSLLSEGGGERLFLVGSACVATPLDYRALEQAFATLTETIPQAANAEFAEFVAVALERPLLTPRFLQELRDFCELFREFVGEPRRPSSVPPPPNRRVRPRADASIVAVALSPADAGRSARDPLRALVEARQLLHEAQAFAAEQPGALATPLEDYGVLVTLPLATRDQAPLSEDRARRLAEKLRQLAQVRLRLSTVAGAAVALGEPEARDAVARRAVLALRLALGSGQTVLLLDEVAAAPKAVRHSHVLQSLDRLCSTFERQAMSEAAAMAHGFIQTVTRFSGARLDLARLEFVLAVTQVAKTIQRRHCLAAEMPERWGDEAASRFDACSGLEELTDELKRTLNRLALLTTTSDAPSYLRIEELIDYLRHNLAEPIRLPHLARRTGFSVPSFCRVFKRATGHSLLTYVRGLRIDRAKHLLATTELSNTSVAELSGFHSQHHFIRSFKKVMRSTPGEYRRSLGVEAQA